MKGVIFVLFSFVALSFSSLTPTHVQLTLTGTETTLQVTFTTSTKPTNPSVTFWLSSYPSKVVNIVAGANNIHTFSYPNGSVDYITSITISPLLASTQYSYYVSGDTNINSTNSATYQFVSLPDDSSTLRIGIYGDLGAYGTGIVEKGTGGLIYWAQNHKFDFIVHNGDLAYNLDTNAGEIGNEFLTNIEPVSAIIPYVVTPGNHEFMDSSETFYNNWFLGQTLLGKSSNSSDPIMYYSFDIGTKVHFVVISTEVYCEDTDNLVPQYKWLEQDLAQVRNRTVQPWILVFGHRQIYIGSQSFLHSRLMRLGLQCNDSTLQYCNYTNPCDSGKNCGYSIEKLLNDYKVDVYFAGHQHSYNRMYPISNDLTYEVQDSLTYVNPQFPVYVVSGAAGDQNSLPPTVPKLEDLLDGPTVISVGGSSFSLLSLFNNTHLKLEQNDIINNGTIVDTFWIEKNNKLPPWNKTASLTLISDSQLVCDQ